MGLPSPVVGSLMAERASDDKPPLDRGGAPDPGQRKPPTGQVKALPDKVGGERVGHGQGSADLLSALRDVDFPATRQAILERAGDRFIALGDGRTVRLGTIVQKTAPAEFADARELVAEANAVWDDVERVALEGGRAEGYEIERRG